MVVVRHLPADLAGVVIDGVAEITLVTNLPLVAPDMEREPLGKVDPAVVIRVDNFHPGDEGGQVPVECWVKVDDHGGHRAVFLNGQKRDGRAVAVRNPDFGLSSPLPFVQSGQLACHPVIPPPGLPKPHEPVLEQFDFGTRHGCSQMGREGRHVVISLGGVDAVDQSDSHGYFFLDSWKCGPSLKLFQSPPHSSGTSSSRAARFMAPAILWYRGQSQRTLPWT